MRNRFLVAIVGLLAGSGFGVTAEPEIPPPLAMPAPVWKALSTLDEEIITPYGGWISGEFFYGWTSRGPITPPVAALAAVEAGKRAGVGQAEDEPEFIKLPGGRASAGYWLNPDQSLAVEARGILLSQGSVRQAISSETDDNPAMVSDSLNVTSTARFWGTEANVLVRCCSEWGYQLDLIGGFRYQDLVQRLQVDQLPLDFGGLPAPLLASTDNFRTRNQFYGGQAGGRILYQLFGEVWSIDLRGVLALGATSQTIDISGTTIQTRPGMAPSTLPFGVLTSTSRRGRATTDQFSVSPQVEIRVCYQPLDCLRVFAGYSFLGWTSVSRPGDQTSLDAVRDSLFCVQGILIGGDFRY